MTISESIKANVRAVLLSKTDGSGVLVSTFLRDYKSIIGEPLMYKNMGYSNLEEFIKDLPEVCRLDYSDKDMAYRLFGIAKPNTYASSFMKRAEGNSGDVSNKVDRQRRNRSNKGNKVQQSLDEDWQPNDRGHISLCFPNNANHGLSVDDVKMMFSAIGEPAEVNIIPTLIFVRYREQTLAKKAVQMFGPKLGLRRADERKGDSRRERKVSTAIQKNQNNNAKYSPNNHSNHDDWDGDPAPVKKTYSQLANDKKDTAHAQIEPHEKVQVYIGNLPNEMTQTDLEGLASAYANIGSHLHHQKGTKTYAFVDFNNIAEGVKMINELHDTIIKGRTLIVRFANRDLNQVLLKEKDANTLPPKSSNDSLSPKGSIERQFEKLAIHKGHESNHQSMENITRTVTRNSVQTNSQPGGYPHAGGYPNTVNTYSPTSQTSSGSSPANMPPLEKNVSRNRYNDPEMPLLESVEPQYRRRNSHEMPPLESIQPQNRRKNNPEMPPLESIQPQNRRKNYPEMPPLESIQQQNRRKRNEEGHWQQGQGDLESDMPPLEKTELPRSQELTVFDSRSRLSGEEAIQLFIGNFPYGTREEDLLALLAPYGILSLKMMNKETTNRSTYAFATCCDLMHAQKAIEDCDQSFFRGRRLSVTLANPFPQPQFPSPASSNSSLNYIGSPVANITCTVGGDHVRQVQVEELFNGAPSMGAMQPQLGGDSRYSDRNANFHHSYNDRPAPNKYTGGPVMKTEYNFRRITCLLKDYSKIVSKLRGDELFVNGPGTTMAVMVTQVDSDRVFWGQVIEDSVSGDNMALRKLVEVTQMLQDESIRTSPIKGLGRCTAMYKGEWFRAWCTYILHRDGQDYCDLLYVDYGNTDQVPRTDVFLTNPRVNDIWCLPPMAKPFKLIEPNYDLASMTDNLAVFEVLDQASSANNFVTTVSLRVGK